MPARQATPLDVFALTTSTWRQPVYSRTDRQSGKNGSESGIAGRIHLRLWTERIPEAPLSRPLLTGRSWSYGTNLRREVRMRFSGRTVGCAGSFAKRIGISSDDSGRKSWLPDRRVALVRTREDVVVPLPSQHPQRLPLCGRAAVW